MIRLSIIEEFENYLTLDEILKTVKEDLLSDNNINQDEKELLNQYIVSRFNVLPFN